MIVKFVDKNGNSETLTLQAVPRVGDSIQEWFYKPSPVVTSVRWNLYNSAQPDVTVWLD